MADPSVINEWLKKADEDFGFAVSIIEDSTFYAQICFYFHKAAEKYLKSTRNQCLQIYTRNQCLQI
jgi:HEPN domain-containing protein